MRYAITRESHCGSEREQTSSQNSSNGSRRSLQFDPVSGFRIQHPAKPDCSRVGIDIAMQIRSKISSRSTALSIVAQSDATGEAAKKVELPTGRSRVIHEYDGDDFASMRLGLRPPNICSGRRASRLVARTDQKTIRGSGYPLSRCCGLRPHFGSAETR